MPGRSKKSCMYTCCSVSSISVRGVLFGLPPRGACCMTHLALLDSTGSGFLESPYAPAGPTEDLSRRPERSEMVCKTRYKGDLTIVASRRLKRPQYFSPRRPRDRFEPKDTDGAKSVSPTPGTPNSGACSQTGASSCNRIRRPSQHMCEDWEEETEEETKKRERLSVPHNS